MIDFKSSDIISSAALALSVFATWKSIQVNKSQVRLNELLTEKEENERSNIQKAEVSANFYSLGSSKYRLKVFNKGKSVARDVEVSFPDGGDVPVIASDLAAKFPISLEPHQSVEVVATVWMGMKRKHTVLIEWADDSSKSNSKKLELTI